MTTSLPLSTDPQSIKKLEKQLHKESKVEDADVKHALKDLASLEKEAKKNHKAVDKAQHRLSKTEKVETSAASALNKATNAHEIAISNVSSAVKDLGIKQQIEERLKSELEAKRVEVESLVTAQHVHNQERESKIAEIHAARAGEGPIRSATTTSSPSVEPATVNSESA